MKDVPFHGEFSSADASALSEANSRFTLYAPGSTTVLTVGASDRVLIWDIMYDYSGATARTFQVYDGSDNMVDAGENLDQATLVQNSRGTSENHQLPLVCQSGTYPKVKSSGAGQITVLIAGFIRRSTA